MKVNVLKKVSTASSIVEAKNRDQAIKEFLSIEVLRNIKDKAVESVVRDIIFKVAKNLDWEQALKSALHYSPELKLKLKDYKLESSVVTSTKVESDVYNDIFKIGSQYEKAFQTLIKENAPHKTDRDLLDKISKMKNSKDEDMKSWGKSFADILKGYRDHNIACKKEIEEALASIARVKEFCDKRGADLIKDLDKEANEQQEILDEQFG